MHFLLHHTAQCTAKIVFMSRKGGTGGGRWGLLPGDVAVVAVCRNGLVEAE